AFITMQQKELLYAIAREGVATKLTSAAFVKRHQLKSASSVQSAAKKLLEYDIITQKGHEYTISDPLLSIWLRERMG
ncbi:MAG: ATPase, partial [Muribaculaceae bacterium]|nr:ATPase [Muribaculaceae bacterium]